MKNQKAFLVLTPHTEHIPIIENINPNCSHQCLCYLTQIKQINRFRTKGEQNTIQTDTLNPSHKQPNKTK